MSNSTNTSTQVQSGYIGFIIAPFALITIGVNVFFFTIGLKTLKKKKAHNMLVLSMCGGDCLNGVSLFILAFINKIGHAFSEMCLSQITIYFVSLSMTLTVALMICVERFITIKHNNYGLLMHSEGWKKKIAAITIICTTGYVVLCIIVVPRRTNDTNICYFVHHYDDYHHRIIMSLLSGLFVCLAFAIIVLYVMIVYFLFQLINQWKKIAPLRDGGLKTIRQSSQFERSAKMQMESMTYETYVTTLEQAIGTENNENGIGQAGQIIDIIGVVSPAEVNVTSGKFQEGQNCHNTTSTSENEYRKGTCTKTSSSLEKKSSVTTIEITGSQKERQIKETWNDWERRALTTSGYIIGSTLLLQGPLIFCLACDALGLESENSTAIGNISALLANLQCVIDPFIYAFRFYELRKAMKDIICCRKIQ